jgi:glycosyltransferase involved in cell wall biosynthesis
VAARNLRLAAAVPRLRRARLIYLNTSWTIRVLALLGPGGPPVVAHVHELDLDIDLLPSADLRRLRHRPDHYVVGTPVAAANLIERHGVDAGRILLHPYFVEPVVPERHHRPEGVAADAVLVGSAGVTNWRKAPDLFVQLASRVIEQVERPVHFVWIGGVAGGPRQLVAHDLRNLGLEAVVHFVGEQADPWSWFAGLDLLVLGSREDTFPLVCLEAGSLGVPIATFDQGGIPDLVRACAGGVVVPHLDVPALAEAVAGMVEDPDRREAAGRRLAERIALEHGPDAGADLARAIEDLVRCVIGPGSSSALTAASARAHPSCCCASPVGCSSRTWSTRSSCCWTAGHWSRTSLRSDEPWCSASSAPRSACRPSRAWCTGCRSPAPRRRPAAGSCGDAWRRWRVRTSSS